VIDGVAFSKALASIFYQYFQNGGEKDMWLNLMLLQQKQPTGGGLMGFLPLILIFIIFYFLLIAPMRRRQKKLQEMIKNLKVGDKVITTGGIYGTVVGIGNNHLQLKIADKVKIDVARQAIAGLQREDSK
jgi:preprotein translocase subunit YajC